MLGRMDKGGTRRSPPPVTVITTAPPSPAQDVGRRERRYLIQMGTRVACFAAAVAIDHWTRWLFVAGAVVLPYIAVVLANAGQDRQPGTPTPVVAPELPPARRAGLEDKADGT